MSIINNGLLLASGADAAVGYQISRSLRFNSADSAYLSRTPGSAGSRTTWTWSGWVKRGKFVGDEQTLFAASTSSPNNQTVLYLSGTEKLDFRCVDGSSLTARIVTTAVYRDTGAWMHVVLAVDTTQATASNRFKLYVNGSQVTALDTATYPSQNYNTHVNNTIAHSLGLNSPFPAYPFDGYLADVYLLDGTATTPSTFAETDAITGQWVPKTPTGISYGTNGFRLTFSDNSGTTSTTLGKDSAGSNNWTPSGFSVASGSGNDSLVDSPTSYGTDTGAGNEVRGNYATLNPLATGGSQTLTNGNLELNNSTADGVGAYRTNSTIAVSSGKYYWEVGVIAYGSGYTYSIIGIDQLYISNANVGGGTNSYGWYIDGSKVNAGSSSSYGSGTTTGDIIMFALDLDNNKFFVGKNGTWFASSNPATGASPMYSINAGTYAVVARAYNSSGTTTLGFNFGQRAFAYTAPSGYKALVDTNLTAPTIAKPANYFDVKLYTGNGSTQTVSGLGFSPDLVWIKSRASAYEHVLHDAIRGANKQLFSSLTNAEQSDTNQLTAFNSDGFTLGNNSTGVGGVNYGTGGYVAWAWDAASSNSTNTSGTITSTVRANATAGFSIVTYTGTGADATVGHGLGAAPSLYIVKSRSIADGWYVYHSSLGNTKYLRLNATNAEATLNIWNNAGPSSTTFSIGGTNGPAGNGVTYVAYCFAPVAGYSAFGSYTGNGSSDGPFVFTGHRSRWLMVKRTDVANEWTILDTARSTYNEAKAELYPSASAAEGANGGPVDINSNGFKLRTTASNWNTSSGTYIYASFAEFPFAYARAR